ncbi:hypothetical protein CBS101457_004326 [Exobasidium rhododendri]|nr:hypothetical protein CBS101457_004326 [Exobasidium rhododendri]
MTSKETEGESSDNKPHDSGSTSVAAHDESKADLLDGEGDLSSAFTKVLFHIFQRFAHSAQERQYTVENQSGSSTESCMSSSDKISSDVSKLEKESENTTDTKINKLTMTEEELDQFTKVVNQGEVMSVESKDEMKEYLDVDEKGNLTFDGFCEMYHLQSGGDADETWKDLKALGYNDQLQLIDTTTRK